MAWFHPFPQRRAPRTGPHAAAWRFAAALAFSVLAPTLPAQPARMPPHLGYLYPAGGKSGTTVTILVGGQNLNRTLTAYVAGEGVIARVIDYDRPLTQKEFNERRDRLQSLVERRAAALGLPLPERFDAKKTKTDSPNPDTPATAPKPSPSAAEPKPTWTPEDQKALEELRALIWSKRPNRQGNPAIAETVTLEVSLSPDAKPGPRVIRLRTQLGLSNPLTFHVSSLDEFVDPAVTATTHRYPGERANANIAAAEPSRPAVDVALPVLLNGQILAGESDRYRFPARKGQHIVFATNARALVPYLADAVPGWFQPVVAIHDEHGREVSYSDSFRFSPDPIGAFEVPADGIYTVTVRDSIYRGREDFVYRIAIGELPMVSDIFPLGGQTGAKSVYAVSGQNLPPGLNRIEAEPETLRNRLIALNAPCRADGLIGMETTDAAGHLEAESSDAAKPVERITLPTIIDGRIAAAGDVDVFRFTGQAGAVVIAEVHARALGSPLDATLRLTDAAGTTIAFNDDADDKSQALITHHADARFQVTLPADGEYQLAIADAQQKGGPDYAYRLHVHPPQPDFELRTTPSAINAALGGDTKVVVYALRRDGFAGEIRLRLRGGPPGVTLANARIAAGEEKAEVLIHVAGSAREQVTPISITGLATIGGAEVIHTATPADDMMQAFAYHHLVPTSELLLNVARGNRTANTKPDAKKPGKKP